MNSEKPVRVWFDQGGMVVDAVSGEPVSALNSLLSEELTGNSDDFGYWVQKYRQNAARLHAFGRKFPRHRSRELKLHYKEPTLKNRE